MTIRLPGRVALVTGAGRGLGAAHARALAAAGAAVVVNDLSVTSAGDPEPGRDVAARTVAQIRRAGGTAIADRSDIAEFTGARRAVDCALSAFGRLDILVNNAGILSSTPLSELSASEMWRHLEVAVLGSAGTAKAALTPMRRQGYGRIVNTVSEAALRTGHHAGPAYAAAKSALWGLTMAMADELAGSGVTVNALSPGALTRMSREHLAQAGQPMGLAPEQVSLVLLALVDESAADINGRVIHAAGTAIREYRLQRMADTPLVARLLATAELE